MRYLLIAVFTVVTLSGFSQGKGLELAEDLFYNFRMDYSYQEYQNQLAAYSLDSLAKELDTDQKRITFWVNIYNVYAQIKMQENPSGYQKRFKFFGEKSIVIGGELFSLNQIEHGILRHSKCLLTKGATNKLFVSKREKMLRVQELDPRIHFALNCGAESCPPIAFYEVDHINEQLEVATEGFLKTSTTIDSTTNQVEVSRILSWYRGDFGGKKGIVTWLKKYKVIADDAHPKVKFASYNWNPTPKDYQEK
jgi:hypothetical protein